MKLTRRDFSLRTLLAPTALALDAFVAPGLRAQQLPATSDQGYWRLNPGQRSDAPGTPEVLEFFSYACPHCFDLEHYLATWSRHLAPGVAFVRVPVPFLMSAEVLMRSYYAFTAMGMETAMTTAVFAAIHVQKQHVDTLESVAPLVKKAGGDPARFLALASSFGLGTKVERARELAKSCDIDSTPTFVVNRQFATSPATAGGYQQALALVDALLRTSVAVAR